MTPIQKFIYDFCISKNADEKWTEKQFLDDILNFEEIDFIEELMEEYAAYKISSIISHLLKSNFMQLCNGKICVSQDAEVESRVNVTFYPDNKPVTYNVYWWDLISAIGNSDKTIILQDNKNMQMHEDNGN